MEKERKSSKEYRGIFGALCVTLIMLLLTGAGGYTYARYMSQENGTGNADVANWSFKIAKNGEETKNPQSNSGNVKKYSSTTNVNSAKSLPYAGATPIILIGAIICSIIGVIGFVGYRKYRKIK